MNRIDNRHVVVGVDDALTCLPAVRAAARQAAARDVPLFAVHAATRHTTPRSPTCPDRASAVLAAARDEVPGLTVHQSTTAGSAEFVLLSEAHRASVLAIGSRGHGARSGRLVGALGLRLAGRTSCPLLIARCPGNPSGPVVVGVDDPPESDHVLTEAFRQARALERPLTVVHAWHALVPALAGPPATYGVDLTAMFEEEAVAAAIEHIATNFPDVRWTADVSRGRDRPTLLGAATDAALLVVGAHRDPGPMGLIAGSMALTAAAHAPCPVLVVADPRR